MSDIAIRCEGLSKQYQIGERESYKALRDVITEAGAAPFRRLRSALDRRPKSGDGHQSSVPGRSSNNGHRSSVSGQPSADGLFWALDDVSFDVKQGEVVGIIGRNGAGKSTLLKILSRITKPTKGHAEIHGRVGSLLEVGTGFHPELTGRENIYLNAAILGMRRAEVERKFDEIVAFAEVEKFIDTPVKRYSSGMYVRLAFAVAAHMETEILLVDEVLAVGDSVFQKKCIGKMSEVAHEGRTVLFVSHNLQAVRNLCSEGLVLNQGHVVFNGDIENCISKYEGEGTPMTRWSRTQTVTDARLAIESVEILLSGDQPEHVLISTLKLRSIKPHKPAFLSIDIADSLGTVIMQALPTIEGFITSDTSEHEIQVAVELPPMVPGYYSVTVWVGSHNTETFDEIRQAAFFEISTSPTPGRTFPHTSGHGVIVPNSRISSSKSCSSKLLAEAE